MKKRIVAMLVCGWMLAFGLAHIALAGGWDDLLPEAPVQTPEPIAAPKMELSASAQAVRNGNYTIMAVGANLCVDAQGGAVEHGTRIQLWEPNGTTAQEWQIEHLGDGIYSVIGVGSSLAIEISNSATENGATVALYAFNPSFATMTWRIVPCADGQVKFVNAHSGLCLDITGGDKSLGTLLQGWKDNDSEAQRFLLVPVR